MQQKLLQSTIFTTEQMIELGGGGEGQKEAGVNVNNNLTTPPDNSMKPRLNRFYQTSRPQPEANKQAAWMKLKVDVAVQDKKCCNQLL